MGFIVFIIVAFVVISLIFASLGRKSHISGKSGEKEVSRFIARLKENDEIIIDNFLASRNKDNTDSIQIDHIFISHKGIFIIETKDYRGRIYGGKDQKDWTQTIGYNRIHKNSFYNPIMQNATHIRYIEKLIRFEVPCYSVVIFLDADTSRVSNVEGILFNLYSFRKWYKTINEKPLTCEIINSIGSLLINEVNNHPITIEEHINNIHRRHGK